MRTRKLINAFSVIRFWQERLYRAIYMHADDLDLSDPQLARLTKAAKLVDEARMEVEAVFGPEIGIAVIREKVRL